MHTATAHGGAGRTPRGAAARGLAWVGAAAAALVGAAIACGNDRPKGERLRTASAGALEAPGRVPEEAPTSVRYGVHLGTYGDSLSALRTARALADSGWNPVVHPALAGEARQFRVYVALSTDSLLPEFVAAGIRVVGGDALVVRDTFSTAQLAGAPTVSQVVPVMAGNARMTARTRWMLSPDSTALIAMQDPHGKGNEPVPDGAVFATERLGCYVQLDSVWDVAPAPDWERVAVGRAYSIATAGGARPSATAQALAAQLRITEDTVRTAAFPVGEPPVVRGYVHPVVIEVEGRSRFRPFGAQPGLRTRAIPMLGGWRVRWAADGQTLAVGGNPVAPRDDAAPRGWTTVPDTGGARALDESDVEALGVNRWVTGPVLDPSLPVILTRGRPPAAGGVVTSAGGWIRVADASGRRRIIGPGVPLAVTRGGAFVLALAPEPATLRDAPTAQLVVYAARAGSAPAVPSACHAVDVMR